MIIPTYYDLFAVQETRIYSHARAYLKQGWATGVIPHSHLIELASYI